MATDFFDRQDDARRRTTRLVVLFVIAVVLIVLTVYAAMSFIVIGATHEGPKPAFLDPARLGLVTTAVLVVITSGSLYKMAALRSGGDAIAQMLNGRLLDPSVATPPEKMLLNVVEEMSIASGTPVPHVYVLDEEPSINAFAAGFTAGDAVVAVSRGAIEHLTRDELQGVIGHEFSHIVNGDMTLNLRLMGLVHGILVLALIGQLVMRLVSNGASMRTNRRSDDKGGDNSVFLLLIAGVVLFAIGSIGVLLGRIIKSAISRQREFLADASSVQFTRNPEGLAGALKKIGGQQASALIRNVNAEQASHMFFSECVWTLGSLLASHPPLEERIRRLDSNFDGQYPAVASQGAPHDEPELAVSALSGGLGSAGGAATALTPGAAMASIGAPTQEHIAHAPALIATLPAALVQAARELFTARAVVFATLLDSRENIRRDQVEEIEQRSEPGTMEEVSALVPLVEATPREARIALVDLTLPTLRRLSPAQYRTFRGNVEALARADRMVSLFEFTLNRMLLKNLDSAFLGTRPPAVRFRDIASVASEVNVLLSALARVGHDNPEQAAHALSVANSRLLPTDQALELLPPDRCTLVQVNAALEKLAQAAPAVKRRVLDACAFCVAADGLVNCPESELLRATSDALDCPMPPFIAGSSPVTTAIPSL